MRDGLPTETGSCPILEVKDLEVQRGGVTTLHVPALQIKDGEIFCLIGPNGSGKTTLLQTLSYLEPSFNGKIFFRGKQVEADCSLEYRRKLAMVFQEPLLFNTTVFNNIASGLKIRRLNRGEINARVMEQMERFGISHLARRSARTLSGGEAQRTSLARAFALGPELLFLDEPFAALDQLTRESLLGDLKTILGQTGTTTILATHDRKEALGFSGLVAVMNRGRIEQLGPPDEVANFPATEFVASFVGMETILRGRVIRKNGGTFVADVSGKDIEAVGEVLLGESVVLCIRPENVTLSTQPLREPTSARNVFPGRITKMVSFGPYQKVLLDCTFPLSGYVTNRSRDELSLTEGKEVQASFKATAVTVIKEG